MIAILDGLPALTLINSWSLLARVVWRGRLDLHFAAGLLVAARFILRYLTRRHYHPGAFSSASD